MKSGKTTIQKLQGDFVEEIDKLGGKAFLIEEKEVASKLKTILSDRINKLVIYQTPLVNRLIPKTFLSESTHLSVDWLPSIKPPDFDEEGYRQRMIQAGAGLVAAHFLIADSGTIVLHGENHRAQLVTLLPPILIVLATTQQLVHDLFAFHNVLREKHNHDFPTLHYITGPSRTSDIEKTLILGVHGPVELYVLIVA